MINKLKLNKYHEPNNVIISIVNHCVDRQTHRNCQIIS